MTFRTLNGIGWDIQELPKTGGIIIINDEPYKTPAMARTAMDAIPWDGKDRRVCERLEIAE